MEYTNDEGAQCELDVVRVLPEEEEEEEYVIESEHIESGPIYTEERLVGRGPVRERPVYVEEPVYEPPVGIPPHEKSIVRPVVLERPERPLLEEVVRKPINITKEEPKTMHEPEVEEEPTFEGMEAPAVCEPWIHPEKFREEPEVEEEPEVVEEEPSLYEEPIVIEEPIIEEEPVIYEEPEPVVYEEPVPYEEPVIYEEPEAFEEPEFVRPEMVEMPIPRTSPGVIFGLNEELDIERCFYEEIETVEEPEVEEIFEEEVVETPYGPRTIRTPVMAHMAHPGLAHEDILER